MYAKAIYVDGKIVTGRHHGEAFGMLSEVEKCSDTLLSGFYDEITGKSFCEECTFYTKSVYLVRHARPSKGYDEDQDPDLSKEGIDKAHNLATFMSNIGIRQYVGYTSPYLRCLITADIISRTTGIPFSVNPCLAEPAENNTVLENHAKDFPQFTWTTSEEFHFDKEDVNSYSSRIKVLAEALNPFSIVVTHYTPIVCLAKMVSGHEHPQNKNLSMGSIIHINNNKIVQLETDF